MRRKIYSFWLASVFSIILTACGNKVEHLEPITKVDIRDTTFETQGLSELNQAPTDLEETQTTEDGMSYAEYLYAQRKKDLTKTPTVIEDSKEVRENATEIYYNGRADDTVSEQRSHKTDELSGETTEEDFSDEIKKETDDEDIEDGSADLQKEPEKQGTVKIEGSTLNIRSTPSVSGEKMGSLSDGDTVSIIGEADGWLKIIVDGEEGYIRSQFVEYPQ